MRKRRPVGRNGVLAWSTFPTSATFGTVPASPESQNREISPAAEYFPLFFFPLENWQGMSCLYVGVGNC